VLGSFLRQLVQVDGVLAVPAPVGLLRGDLVLDLAVLDDPAGLEVDVEDLARRETALGHYLFGGVIEHAGLRRQDDVAVLRQLPAAGCGRASRR